jgi:predicted nucleic acid-binding protein
VRIVADASVILEAWMNDSVVASQSRELLRTFDACVPDLVFPEVGHVLRAEERLRAVDFTELFDTFINSPWTVFRFNEYASLTWPLRHDVSLYDACYVALAMGLRIPLVTLDRKLASVATRYCEVRIPGE